jgi:hypothetical protein
MMSAQETRSCVNGVSIVAGAGLCDFDIPSTSKHLLRGRAAQAVLAADEEDVLHQLLLYDGPPVSVS